MGACCTNEARDKKVDSKEAKLFQRDEVRVEERSAKSKNEVSAPTSEDSIFEANAVKIRSGKDEVNVRLFSQK